MAQGQAAVSSFDLSRTVQDLGGTVMGLSGSGLAAALPRERGQEGGRGGPSKCAGAECEGCH